MLLMTQTEPPCLCCHDRLKFPNHAPSQNLSYLISVTYFGLGNQYTCCHNTLSLLEKGQQRKEENKETLLEPEELVSHSRKNTVENKAGGLSEGLTLLCTKALEISYQGT